MKVSIVGSLRDQEVACSASDRQGSNFESCVWRTVSSQSSHHPQEVLLAQFSLYVHKGGLKPDSFHFILFPRTTTAVRINQTWKETLITRRLNFLKLIRCDRHHPSQQARRRLNAGPTPYGVGPASCLRLVDPCNVLCSRHMTLTEDTSRG